MWMQNLPRPCVHAGWCLAHVSMLVGASPTCPCWLVPHPRVHAGWCLARMSTLGWLVAIDWLIGRWQARARTSSRVAEHIHLYWHGHTSPCVHMHVHVV